MVTIITNILIFTLLIPDMLSESPQPVLMQKQMRSEQLQDGSASNDSSLENLVKTDQFAYIIWNITKKYNISLSVEKCRTEVENNPKLISFHIVNISLEETGMYLYQYSRHDGYYVGNSLKQGHIMYERCIEIAADQELYLTTVKHIMKTGTENKNNDNIICASSSESLCGCVSKDSLNGCEETLALFKNKKQYLWEFVMFGKYLDPTFRIIIMIIGLIMNGALLLVFINERTVRTESNILIVNLIVNNVFMLIFYLPANYITMYHINDYKEISGYASIQIFVVSASAITILLLNIQRYFDISRALNTSNQNSRLTPTYRCIIYLTVIWLFSSAVASIFLFTDIYEAIALEVIIYFLLYLFVFSIVMVVFNSLTARKLQHSAEQGQTSIEFQNVIGSAVILHLTLVYYVTHLLCFIYSLFDASAHDSGADYDSPTSVRIVIFILHLIFFSYPCLSVLALYKCSGTYRSFLKFYLFRCWYSPAEGQYATMNSEGNSDAQRLFE